MAFVLVTGDAAILGYSLFLGLEGLGLGGNWIAAIPTIWLVPLGLAVGALRYRPLVQVWATIVTMIALVGVVCALGFRSFLNGFGIAEVPSDLEANIGRLFSLPAYLMPTYLEEFAFFKDSLAIKTSQQALLGDISAKDLADQWAEYLTKAQQKFLAKK